MGAKDAQIQFGAPHFLLAHLGWHRVAGGKLPHVHDHVTGRRYGALHCLHVGAVAGILAELRGVGEEHPARIVIAQTHVSLRRKRVIWGAW